jgi:hypothetical protein
MAFVAEESLFGFVDQTELTLWEKQKSVEVRTRVRLVFDCTD